MNNIICEVIHRYQLCLNRNGIELYLVLCFAIPKEGEKLDVSRSFWFHVNHTQNAKAATSNFAIITSISLCLSLHISLYDMKIHIHMPRWAFREHTYVFQPVGGYYTFENDSRKSSREWFSSPMDKRKHMLKLNSWWLPCQGDRVAVINELLISLSDLVPQKS